MMYASLHLCHGTTADQSQIMIRFNTVESCSISLYPYIELLYFLHVWTHLLYYAELVSGFDISQHFQFEVNCDMTVKVRSYKEIFRLVHDVLTSVLNEDEEDILGS